MWRMHLGRFPRRLRQNIKAGKQLREYHRHGSRESRFNIGIMGGLEEVIVTVTEENAPELKKHLSVSILCAAA